MKKNTLTLALLVCIATAAAFTAAGCKKQVEQTPEQDQGTERTASTEASGEVFVTNGTWTARVNGVTKYTRPD